MCSGMVTTFPRVFNSKQKSQRLKVGKTLISKITKFEGSLSIVGSCHMPDFEQIEVHLFNCFMPKPVSRKLNWDGNVCHNTSNEAKSTLATGQVF